ncbi:MAG: hypothetical protein LBQ22_07385 [Bacteroidales bacterium]|nr:hypothetical protein [Bacteroidales bacterium]
MNPFIYDNLKKDMQDAVKLLIANTDYYIERLDESSIVLSNEKKHIMFYLEATNLCSEIKNIDDTDHFAVYELFEKENMNDKYPLNTKLKLSYEEWNKYEVYKILEILMTYLRKYIE